MDLANKFMRLRSKSHKYRLQKKSGSELVHKCDYFFVVLPRPLPRLEVVVVLPLAEDFGALDFFGCFINLSSSTSTPSSFSFSFSSSSLRSAAATSSSS